MMGPEGQAEAILRGCVHQQTHGHDHQEGHDPLRFLR
jgi:hypothetical protein